MQLGALGIYACLFLGLYFEVFLLISFLEKKPVKKTSALPNHYPSVAILVPCWNKGATLGPTVESLLALNYPKDKLSVVIIDDGSTDNTLTAAQKFAGNPQVHIYAKENEGSKFSALNFGLAHSHSDLVGCLDADSFVMPDALNEMVKKLESDASIMAVTPAMKVFRPRNPLELMQAVEYTFGIFYRKMFDNLSAISVLPGPFSIYRREVFAKIGIFRRAHHTEDMEMAFRMHANNLKIANAHSALVYTTVPKTVGALVRQRTRWSQGYLQNSIDYAHMYLNPRFGNFGLFVLPFGLLSFMAGLYISGYTLYRVTSTIVEKILALWFTGVPLHLPAHVEWFYINTSMMEFLVLVVVCMTLTVIFIGDRMTQTKLPFASFISYFALFGFVAPLWLARAAWNTLRSEDGIWLT